MTDAMPIEVDQAWLLASRRWSTWATLVPRCASGRSIILLLVVASGGFAEEVQTPPTVAPPATTGPDAATPTHRPSYRDLSLAELMAVEVTTVTSVTRHPERLMDAAASIQVITQDDIRSSGATSLPEALRLATNLEVAQVDSHQWAISARGFNNTLANKMLVMIDGRTVYTPLYAGVFWDQQQVFLPDLDRIEVVSGPGGTLWGANAVNGVISIISKNSKDTQGLYAEGGGGTTLEGFEGARYGGVISPHLTYRVYEQGSHRGYLDNPNEQNPNDASTDSQGGFRADYDGWDGNLLTVQGDVTKDIIGNAQTSDINAVGSNLLGRWSHQISENSDTRLQLYADQSHRTFPGAAIENLETYDLDFQYRLPVGTWNDVVWGLGYRTIHDDILNSQALAFLPAIVTYQTFSGFVQDEIALIPKVLKLTIGSKIEHTHYVGWDVQPSVRAAWTLDEKQSVWAAASRAVRTPSRLEENLYEPGTPPFTTLQGTSNFESEKLMAYELGYHAQPEHQVVLELSTYYNDYDDIRSVEPISPPAPFPVELANGLKGYSYGAEATAKWNVLDWCTLSGGYTETRVSLRTKPGSTDTTQTGAEDHDPEHMFQVRGTVILAQNWEFDADDRYVSPIVNQSVPGYDEADCRLAYTPKPSLEYALVGQNLLHAHHAEFGPAASRQEIPRSAYVKIVWRY
jgi:iron complex outermembrane receptor protein